MLTSLQAAVVAFLDTARQAPTPETETELRPRLVSVYGGELLKPERLVDVVPAAYVELDQGALTRAGSSRHFTGLHRVDVVLVARNAVGRAAQAHDGARLVTWAINRLRDAEIVVDGRVLQVSGFTWRRLLMDSEARTWTGILTPTFDTLT